MIGRIKSFNFLVGILYSLLWFTSIAILIASKILCFVKAEINTIGISVNGDVFEIISSSIDLVVIWSFSTVSHLLTRITIPFLFLAASQKIFWTWESKPLSTSNIIKHVSEFSIARTDLKIE